MRNTAWIAVVLALTGLASIARAEEAPNMWQYRVTFARGRRLIVISSMTAPRYIAQHPKPGAIRRVQVLDSWYDPDTAALDGPILATWPEIEFPTPTPTPGARKPPWDKHKSSARPRLLLGDPYTRKALDVALERIEPFEPEIQYRCRQYSVDPDLVRAVITHESAGLVNARSSAGAVGLMQVIPSTARDMGVSRPQAPEQNILAGVRYLAYLSRLFDKLDLLLAAYNAGPGAVQRYKGIPPYRETKTYVTRVLSAYRLLQQDQQI